MSHRIRIIAKAREPIPVDLLAKLLVAQARAERQRHRDAAETRQLRDPGDAA